MTLTPPNAAFSRRALLLGALAPGATAAQDAPPLPQTTTPPGAPPAVAPPAPTVRSPAPPVDATKIYYLFFDQPTDVASMRTLRRQLTTLVEAGVPQINLVLNSPGGMIEPMLITYSFIRSLPAIINTHAQGFIQSAATVLFLAGQQRSADHSARFLFHPWQTIINGSLAENQVHERLSQIEAIAAVTNAIYKERTRFSDAEIASFAEGQVIYSAEAALAKGVIQTVADLKIPGPDKARIQFAD